MLYAIQGFFFPNHDMGIGVSYATREAHVMVFTAMVRNIFAGAIGPDPDDETELVGFMTDLYGQSELVNVKISEEQMSFTKLYFKHQSLVNYSFNKQASGLWVGEWTGPKVGAGLAQCLLTKVSRDFFINPLISKIISKR